MNLGFTTYTMKACTFTHTHKCTHTHTHTHTHTLANTHTQTYKNTQNFIDGSPKEEIHNMQPQSDQAKDVRMLYLIT
jgi:hypothetical protein